VDAVSTVAVIGGHGTVGAPIVRALRASGCAVRTPSRRDPDHRIDLVDGAGLDAALSGCDVVIDASNASPTRPEPVIVEGTRLLLEAAHHVGVAHHVCVSIVGIEKVPTRYYRAKLAQEALVEASSVPWTIVRATQFHELIIAMLGSFARRHVIPVVRGRLQPVAAGEVAAEVARVATARPLRARRTVAGPRVYPIAELAELVRAATPGWAIPVPVPLIPRVGRPLRDGALTTAVADVTGREPFEARLQGSEPIGG
jgi:uncharacterized protein YbjT (DUF2867 family)